MLHSYFGVTPALVLFWPYVAVLFGAVILLVPVAMIWRERAAMGQRPQSSQQ